MNALPKHLIGALIALVVIGLLGGGAWYWTSTRLDAAVEARAQANQELSALNSKGIFPSAANLKLLKENQEAAGGLASRMEPRFSKQAAALAKFTGPEGKGLGADAWKQLLFEKREELKKRAEAGKVEVADDFYFAFKRYRVASPPASATKELGVQLAAIEELSKILIDARITSLNEIRRVVVEETGSAAASNNEEALPVAVVDGPDGLYRVYPLEVKFQSSPAALQAVLNGLSASPHFFITRFVTVENQKNNVPRRSEVLTQAGGNAVGTGGTSSPGERGVASAPKLLFPVLGQELLNVRARIDFIVWTAPAPSTPPAAQPATPPNGS